VVIGQQLGIFNIDQSTVVYLKKRRALIQKKKEQEKAEQQRLQDSYLN
jgi:transposase